jgi:chemotaxis protein MotB
MSDAKPELVIIRRRILFDDSPVKGGGVWKIAYADFMTAMMAFFLVLWLLSVLNPDQRQGVATYFNPIKLSEAALAPKGLKDAASKDPSASEGQEGKRQPAGPAQERRGDSPIAEDPPFYEERTLFRDPYATLSEIVARSNDASGRRRLGALASPEEKGMKGGEAYRDPFDPGYWKLAPQAAQEVGRVSEGEPTSNPNSPSAENAPEANEHERLVARQSRPDDSAGTNVADAEAASASLSPLLPPGPASPPADRQVNAQANSVLQSAPAEPAREAEQRAAGPAHAAAKQLQAAISEALSDIKAGAGPVAEVRQVDEGVLVSLTDDASFGMFAVGSAQPRPELVRVVDKIGPLLSKRPGAIVVRGHTDNRPYRSEAYDNWRLSTARAQMAYYMLVRSGVDPERIEHVEGYADRNPKIPSDPAAAQNRRIEILIREKRP